MNKEIKEILDELKNEDNYIEDYGFRYKRIALDDVWCLLDYITNLQKENNQLNNLIMSDDIGINLTPIQDLEKKIIILKRSLKDIEEVCYPLAVDYKKIQPSYSAGQSALAYEICGICERTKEQVGSDSNE